MNNQIDYQYKDCVQVENNLQLFEANTMNHI
jgi:hypothetical protein